MYLDYIERTYAMSNSTKVSVGGTSFTNLLFLVFLVLKLTKVIDWSWWWVTAPLWIPFSMILVFLILVAIASSSSGRRW